MTAEEFAAKAQPLLDADPFVPVALDLATGARVFIDLPEQAALKPNRVVITRRARRPECYGYDVIDRVTRADQLPSAPGGISYAEFDTTIRQFLLQEPFQPFVIELRDGERIGLDERGGAVRAGRVLVIPGEPPRSLVKIAYDQIARLSVKAGATSA